MRTLFKSGGMFLSMASNFTVRQFAATSKVVERNAQIMYAIKQSRVGRSQTLITKIFTAYASNFVNS